MHTPAPHTAATADISYTGTLCAPVELRACASGGHTIIVRMHPARDGQHVIEARAPVAAFAQAYAQAERLVDEINAAAKHGLSTITISAPLHHHHLVCSHATIAEHHAHHPASAAPQRAPDVVKVADLFGIAA